MRLVATFLSLCLLLSSCGHMNSDVSMSAIDANYPTAEIHCDGKVFNGLAICSSADEIQVQGYYEGSVRIDSDRCDIHETPSYIENGVVDVKIKNPSISCVIEVVVSIVYPKDTTTAKRSLKGIIYYKKPTNNTTYKISKIATGTVDLYSFYSEKLTGNDVRVYWKGCGISTERTMTPFSGRLTFGLSDGPNNFNAEISTDKQCVLEMAITDPIAKVGLRVVWLATFYKASFAPLPIPFVKFEDKKFRVFGDKSVAVTGFNDNFKTGEKVSFKKENGTLRLITTSGRVVIGLLQDEVFQWIP